MDKIRLTIDTECEDDGRWLAEIPELPGVMAYGESKDAAMNSAIVLALRVIADEIEHNERSTGHVESVSWAAQVRPQRGAEALC